MQWRKLGRIYCPDGSTPWEQSHASLPIAFHTQAHEYRVYYSTRDDKNRSQVGFIEFDLRKPKKILVRKPEPVIKHGQIGTFDESGAMGSWLLVQENVMYMYYIGWNLGSTVPFRNAVGLAVSQDGGHTFIKYAQGPVLDRSIFDPCFVASCCILAEDVWRMWYLSCIRWEELGGKLTHSYHIKYAESADGVEWRREGKVSVDFKDPNEYAISRPCVIKDKETYKMWYSYRGQSYRIGYAESPDGINWQRKDDLAGINVSESGWDAEMIEYPFVFDHDGDRYMLYNGNGFGKTGFGLAILEQD